MKKIYLVIKEETEAVGYGTWSVETTVIGGYETKSDAIDAVNGLRAENDDNDVKYSHEMTMLHKTGITIDL